MDIRYTVNLNLTFFPHCFISSINVFTQKFSVFLNVCPWCVKTRAEEDKLAKQAWSLMVDWQTNVSTSLLA